jgi:hypothetical protein
LIATLATELPRQGFFVSCRQGCRWRIGLPRRRPRADEDGMTDHAQSPLVTNSWSPAVRWIVSGLLLLHLTAVFVAPFAFACSTPSASSPFADGLMRCFRPYVDLLYLNHGYAFFAPNPGPSHLVRYRIDFADNRPSLEGVFPDLKTQRPRLLYHRHFMLAERLYTLYTPPVPPPELSLDADTARVVSDAQRRAMLEGMRREHRKQLAAWNHSRDLYDAFRNSLAEHLRLKHGGERVTLTRLEHGQLVPADFQILRRLDAPQTYRNLSEGAPAPEVLRPQNQSP